MCRLQCCLRWRALCSFRVGCGGRDSGNSATASPADLYEQIACQHFTGGSDLCRIAKHTDGPDSHLDSFSGTVHELRPEQIEGFHRDRPYGVVGQE